MLLKEPGLYTLLVRCKKDEADSFMAWAMETILPREVRKLAQTVEEHQQAIEEKDSAIALLNDDLTEREQEVVILEQENLEIQEHARQLEYNNTGLQGEIRAKDKQIAHLEQRYVGYLADEKKNNGITVIAKNDEEVEYPFISICGQNGYRQQKKRMVMLKNPGSTEYADGDVPNAIVTYNMWREHKLIETDPQRPRDFRLVGIEQEQLLELRDA